MIFSFLFVCYSCENERLSSVAVSGDFILSQSEVLQPAGPIEKTSKISIETEKTTETCPKKKKKKKHKKKEQITEGSKNVEEVCCYDKSGH